jgi:peptidoglycan/LPS O-acetylase OafA/YrhL
MSNKTFGYRPHVDGLRAVAVLLVVLYHVGVPGPKSGFVGVDVFFVISGYLITSLLFLEAQQGRIDLTAFYARRVRRLFPAMLVVVAATLLLGAIFLLPIFSEQTSLARSAIATSVYLSNFYFWRYTGDYFSSSTVFEPLLHTWSLAVEEQFYLVWPFLIIGLLKLGTRRNLRRDLLVLLVALSAVSFGLSLWATHAQPEAAFYLMPFRAWQFGAGGIVAILLADRAPGRAALGWALSIAGLAAILVGGVMLHKQSFPGWGALLPTLGAAAVIAGGQLAPTNFAAALLSWQPVRFIGLVSYSWYLWHWPLLAIARAASVDLHDLRRDMAIGVVSFVLAALTYYIVENPVRYRRPGPFKTSLGTLAAGAAISLVVAGASVALALDAKHVAGTNERYAALERARADVPVYRATCHLPMMDEFHGLPDRKGCAFGNPEHIGAMLWGDSHADHMSGLMAAFAKKRGDRGIVQRSYSSCRFYGEDTITKSDGEIKACADFNAAVEAEIYELQKHGMTGVIVSTMWNSVFRDSSDPMAAFANTSPEYYAAAAASIDAVVSRLEAAGLRVLLVGPVQLMPHEVPQCLARHSDLECSAPRAAIERQRSVSMGVLRDIVARHSPLVRLWDPIDSLCDAQRCAAVQNGVVLFTDALHLTASGGATLLDNARDSLLWVTGSDQQLLSSGVLSTH